ncbi:hypothetical protein [Streptomyces sp. YIM 98790]|uniref:hypothetical protein n=1 Tax=Streptomyces sp. YIM 98790 TaxID=2689077 RepID=UPI00140C8B1F|nr:hypothetical protein [Streptomyces sp. YIM 98790]
MAAHILLDGSGPATTARLSPGAPGHAATALLATGFRPGRTGTYRLPSWYRADEGYLAVKALHLLADETGMDIDHADRPGLTTLADRIAHRLPGTWTAKITRLTRRVWQEDLAACVWDHHGVLHRALAEHRVPRAAILTDEQRHQLVVIDRPGHPGRLLAAPLAGSGFEDLSAAGIAAAGLPAPDAISLPRDPARAAAALARRLLPHQLQMLHALRVVELEHALRQGQAALAAWDAVSDSLCDAAGQPLDENAYGARQRRRDTQVWDHYRTFLRHAPELLGHVETLNPRILAGHPEARHLTWRLDRLRGALNAGERILHAWQQEVQRMRTVPDPGLHIPYEEAVAERNAEAWTYMDDVLAHGPVLVQLARLHPTSPPPGPHRARRHSRHRLAPASRPVGQSAKPVSRRR